MLLSAGGFLIQTRSLVPFLKGVCSQWNITPFGQFFQN